MGHQRGFGVTQMLLVDGTVVYRWENEAPKGEVATHDVMAKKALS